MSQCFNPGVISRIDESFGITYRLPTVSFRWTLPDLVQIPLENETRHDLLNQSGEDGCDHKDGEDNILDSLLTGVGMEERKSNEEG